MNKTSLQGSVRIEDCVCRRWFSGTAEGECLACTVGTFKNTTGIAACAPCAVSLFSTQDALDDTVACESCEESLGSPFAITWRDGIVLVNVTVETCVCNARAGYDDSIGGSAGCKLCSPGTFVCFEDPSKYESPSSLCVDCVVGQYTDIAGLVS